MRVIKMLYTLINNCFHTFSENDEKPQEQIVFHSLEFHTFFLSIPLGDFLSPPPTGRVFYLLPGESLVLAQAGKKWNNIKKIYFLAWIQKGHQIP